MYKVQEIAEYVIYYVYTKGNIVTNLKLQKILYYIQAEFLVGTQKQCFREHIEAWSFGPVVPCVYMKYNIYGNSFIYPPRNDISYKFSSADKRKVEHIVDACSAYSSSMLTEITQRQTPWIDAYHQGKAEITPESIRQFFIKKEDG